MYLLDVSAGKCARNPTSVNLEPPEALVPFRDSSGSHCWVHGRAEATVRAYVWCGTSARFSTPGPRRRGIEASDFHLTVELCACHGSEQGGRPILRWGPVHTVSVCSRPQPRSVARCGSAWPVTWLAPHTRRALCVVYILHITTVASLWVGPALSRRKWSISHQLLDLTRGLGRLGLATLLRCIVLRIVGLLALET
jgi:hypothetical protein